MTRRLLPYAIAVAFAAVIVSFLVYTQQMASAIRMDATVFSRIYALTFQATSAPDTQEQQRLTDEILFEVLGEVDRLAIPVVVTDLEGTPSSVANLPFDADLRDPEGIERIRRYVEELDARAPALTAPEYNLRIHFGEPIFLRRLRWIPWLQASILFVLVAGGAWLVLASVRGERERIWSAMARESAHQMGTPLSSLVGWLEQLELEIEPESAEGDGRLASPSLPPDLVEEMKADTDRLLKVSRRFELIGQQPSLDVVDVGEIAERLRRYFQARLPSLGSRVSLVVDVAADAPAVLGNETLLEWAFENLIKNALDALAGREGQVVVEYDGVHFERAAFRVHDSGPGIASGVRKRIFEIGFTTKERGWGVGLSLTRRIIEDMHDGSIVLEHSDSGASFRIELPVAQQGDV
ncbi:MAG: HAMP domain-containing sensor histidine kinase [Gemmatimonadetes bacterium]|nr:HAMP domain-containing sensor histidine kinase [Gemmatimonadota bacterium]